MGSVSSVGDITRVIQLAVAPVFLLTAIGTLLSVLTNRLGRAVDRTRLLDKFLFDLTRAGAQSAERGNALAELDLLARRIRLIYASSVLAVLAALFICLLVGVAFVDAFINVNLARVLGGLFILAMLAMIGCLIVFLREIFLAVNTARSVIHDAGTHVTPAVK